MRSKPRTDFLQIKPNNLKTCMLKYLKAVLYEVIRSYIEFRQNFTKETFSYDEHLKS